jgi:hypothetical protein
LLENEKLIEEKKIIDNEIINLKTQNSMLLNDLKNLKNDYKEKQELNKIETQKLIENSKFDMFKTMMDGFNEERKNFEKKFIDQQFLLQQAAKVYFFLFIFLFFNNFYAFFFEI